MGLPAAPPYLEEILAPWDIDEARATPSRWGINNRSWFVESPAGRHVLRLCSTWSRQEVASEHALLRQLAWAGLPFATPVPRASRDGSTARVVDTPVGQRVAALFERIQGHHIDDEDAAAVEAAAAAFAQLDRALARLAIDRPSADPRLERVHALVEDLDALDELGPDAAAFVRRMAGGPTELRATLQPRQLIHEDFAFGNVLVKDGTVVGVLDFEFAARDARVAELACALRLARSASRRAISSGDRSYAGTSLTYRSRSLRWKRSPRSRCTTRPSPWSGGWGACAPATRVCALSRISPRVGRARLSTAAMTMSLEDARPGR